MPHLAHFDALDIWLKCNRVEEDKALQCYIMSLSNSVGASGLGVVSES